MDSWDHRPYLGDVELQGDLESALNRFRRHDADSRGREEAYQQIMRIIQKTVDMLLNLQEANVHPLFDSEPRNHRNPVYTHTPRSHDTIDKVVHILLQHLTKGSAASPRHRDLVGYDGPLIGRDELLRRTLYDLANTENLDSTYLQEMAWKPPSRHRSATATTTDGHNPRHASRHRAEAPRAVEIVDDQPPRQNDRTTSTENDHRTGNYNKKGNKSRKHPAADQSTKENNAQAPVQPDIINSINQDQGRHPEQPRESSHMNGDRNERSRTNTTNNSRDHNQNRQHENRQPRQSKSNRDPDSSRPASLPAQERQECRRDHDCHDQPQREHSRRDDSDMYNDKSRGHDRNCDCSHSHKHLHEQDRDHHHDYSYGQGNHNQTQSCQSQRRVDPDEFLQKNYTNLFRPSHLSRSSRMTPVSHAESEADHRACTCQQHRQHQQQQQPPTFIYLPSSRTDTKTRNGTNAYGWPLPAPPIASKKEKKLKNLSRLHGLWI